MSLPNSSAIPGAPVTTGVRGGIAGRLGGLVMDILLLAAFLFLGVAILEILVRVVVMIVGFASRPSEDYIRRGFVQWDPKRHWNDARALLYALLWAGGAVVVFLGMLKLRRALLARLIDASFESYVSKRYLISREAGALVNLITFVSILGVSVGVMALVVVISVMNGFDRTLVDKMMGVFAHVEVWPADGGMFSEKQYQRILKESESIEDVVGAAPVLNHESFFQPETGSEQNREGALIRGLDVEREKKVTRLADNIIAGKGTPGFREIVLGSELASKLRVVPGEIVYASGNAIATAAGTKLKISKLKVVGVFKSSIYDVDLRYAFTDLKTVRALALIDEGYNSVHLKLSSPDEADVVAGKLQDKLGRDYYVRTWRDINPEFFEALWIEKVAMFIILLLIVLVASFNIVGTLIMAVAQKTREIGILKSMGATRMMIAKIFFFHGTFIGVVGTSLGTAWGLWLCRFVQYDIDLIFQLPPAVYGLDRLPVIMEPQVIGMLAGCSLVICVLASIIPAIRAARLNPIEALRYD